MRVVTAATWDNTVLHTDCEKQRLRLLAAAATRDRDRLHFFVFFFPKESVGGNEQRCELVSSAQVSLVSVGAAPVSQCLPPRGFPPPLAGPAELVEDICRGV